MTRRSHGISLLRAAIGVAIIAASTPSRAAAQSSADDRTVAVWISAAFGPGSLSGATSSQLAGVARANVSVGPWVASLRGAEIGPIFGTGDGISETAVLVGLRSEGRRTFVSAALGYAVATPNATASATAAGAPTWTGGGSSVLAFDLTAHANARIVGVVASLSGSAGPSHVRHTELTAGLELGWFGQ